MSERRYRVRLQGLRLRGRIGVAPRERVSTQELLVDLRLDVARGRNAGGFGFIAGIPETPEDVVCYDALARRVREAVASRHWPLAEDLAEHLARMCLEDCRVRRAKVGVRKPAAVADAEWAGAEVALGRKKRRHAVDTGTGSH